MARQAEISSPDGTRRDGARLSGAAIAALAGGGLLVAFMVQNRDDVTVRFLFWSSTWPLWLLVLVSAVLGGVVWIGVGVLRRHRRRKARRAARAD
ncbi:lipopolysaccharide assembly protein LapA domain-containing protein [Geodermatophilus sp. SYSU D00696]